MHDHHRVCPLERAGKLESRFRRLIQNPRRILKGYVLEGMKVLDFGCGPGVFTVPMAEMVGEEGKVVAADLQDGMLEKLRRKIEGTEVESRIELVKSQEDKIGLNTKFDFILAFYVVHEVPDQLAFFKEIRSILKPGGKFYVAEPKHRVSGREFKEMLSVAFKAGLKYRRKHLIPRSRVAVFE